MPTHFPTLEKPEAWMQRIPGVTDAALALPFPLRPTFLAQVVVPRDLTTDEAERLCALVTALAVPELPQPEVGLITPAV